jgi:hypothetical protein
VFASSADTRTATRQATYNVTPRCAGVTILAVETQ